MLLDQDSNFRFKDQDHKNVVFDLFLEDQDQYLNHENMILDSRTKTKTIKQWSQTQFLEGHNNFFSFGGGGGGCFYAFYYY